MISLKTVLMSLSVLAALLLSGCFASEKPLIVAGEADYPFKTITYEFPGEDDQVTLVRTGEAYTAPEEGGDGKLMLKKVADNTYVLQLEYLENGKTGYLFTVAKLADDGKTAKLLKPFATKRDFEVASGGSTGFAPCKSDADMACVSSLADYVAYALESQGPNDKSINILAME